MVLSVLRAPDNSQALHHMPGNSEEAHPCFFFLIITSGILSSHCEQIAYRNVFPFHVQLSCYEYGASPQPYNFQSISLWLGKSIGVYSVGT